ncbi:MAG: double-strand break repair helicase AddA [Rhodobacteraceae bacterium]|nr:double-strand break repair helicase AddA [Paracoccaceae bacterium]
MIRDAATQRQVDAARPDVSTWLSANAGSGKTRVLTDRVARLLLDGVEPQNILCLTYTKAAATEMQNRLFKRLGGWAMLADQPLRDELLRLGVPSQLSGDFLKTARTLFARAIETPGGLRIQTIHSFCSALLRRFPLEAGVSPQFSEIEDRAADLLREELVTAMADGPEAELVAGLAAYVTDDDIDGLLAEIVANRGAFAEPLTESDLRAAYDVPKGLTQEALLAQILPPGEDQFLQEVQALCAQGSRNDQKVAHALEGVDTSAQSALSILENVFLFGVNTKDPFSAKIGNVPTKALRQGAMASVMPRLNDLMARVETGRRHRLGLSAVTRDLVLYRFARAFLPRYEAAKMHRGWLDFDDLIDKTNALLRDPAVAEWVLFRLDGGIDHILVDEAQDTSPVQWQVIERLAAEFTSGEGARGGVTRTIFVVGDKKQSIYSFQGADPREFDRMKEDFRARHAQVQVPFVDQTLEYSFRSAAPILEAVDTTFNITPDNGLGSDSLHRAFKDQMPGRVDLWPVVDVKDPAPEGEEDWFAPVDRIGAQHHTVVLARRIASFMRETIEAGTPLPAEVGHSGTYEARPVTAGDFLILVRKRSRLFKEIIRACKQQGLPIAGADRLKVMAELAVRDIGALLSFLATPEDDLSLAVVLKSPLFGWSEQQLFDLAHRRTERYLWQGLRARKADFPEVLTVLDDLLAQTDFLRPYDLIERILTRHDGRRLLLGRLGEEAQDGIDALLQQALAYERTEVPSLTGFLGWMQTDDLEIKRQLDSAGDRVRVMTVHGAKGLEAPIVILPDCGPADSKLKQRLLTNGDRVHWRQINDSMPDLQRDLTETVKQAMERERDRLLYVAMTRAEKWLVVAASGALGTKGTDWYTRVQTGMMRANAHRQTFDFEDQGDAPGLQLGEADWSGLPLKAAPARKAADSVLPAFYRRPAPLVAPSVDSLSASDLGGAKALAGADGDDTDLAKARGTLVHHVLETLPDAPKDQWDEIAPLLVESHAVYSPQIDVAAIVSEALGVLRDPTLAHIFASDVLAEVPLTALVPQLGNRRLHATVDRLIVTPTSVLVIDFKTNRTIPEAPQSCPDGVLRQMGAYAAALSLIYPERSVETAILWTAAPRLMQLPHALVSDALQDVCLP